MRSINIKEVIEKNGLDIKEVAEQLFPSNKYPRLALNRVMAGDALLDSDQISKLALLSDMSISGLYESEWRKSNKDEIVTFKNDKFMAELNTTTWVTKIFDNGSLFHESIIHSRFTQLGEYLKAINDIIIEYNNNK